MASEREFLEFAAGVLGIPAEKLSLETTYGSIPEWDSMAQLRLVTEIAAKYNVEIPFAEVVNVTSLWEFLRRINGGASLAWETSVTYEGICLFAEAEYQ